MNAQKFYINLRHYMALKEKSQRDVAKGIGVSPAAFNAWYNGQSLPRIDRVKKIADFLDIGIDEKREAIIRWL